AQGDPRLQWSRKVPVEVQEEAQVDEIKEATQFCLNFCFKQFSHAWLLQIDGLRQCGGRRVFFFRNRDRDRLNLKRWLCKLTTRRFGNANGWRYTAFFTGCILR